MEEQHNQEDMKHEHAAGTEQSSSPEGQSPQGVQSSDGKLWAVLGYVFSILFFVPLVMDDLKNSPYSRFHANQQLILLLMWVVGSILTPMYGLGVLVHIFAIVLMVMGIVNASKDVMKPLPLVGGITIIK